MDRQLCILCLVEHIVFMYFHQRCCVIGCLCVFLRVLDSADKHIRGGITSSRVRFLFCFLSNSFIKRAHVLIVEHSKVHDTARRTELLKKVKSRFLRRFFTHSNTACVCVFGAACK